MELGPARKPAQRPSLSAAPSAPQPQPPTGRPAPRPPVQPPAPPAPSASRIQSAEALPITAPLLSSPKGATLAPDENQLERPLRGLPGIGPRTAERLALRGLTRIIDVLYFLPRRWEDLRSIQPVGSLQEGVLQTTVAIVEKCRIVPARRRFLEANLRGEDGQPLLARWFHFNGGMARRLLPGQRLLVTGTPLRWKGSLQIIHPEVEYLGLPPGTDGGASEQAEGEPETAATLGRVRVRYPDVEGVPGRTLERLCQTVCTQFAAQVPDGLPASLRHKLSLPALDVALQALHLLGSEVSPRELELLNQGLAPPQRRLIFEELFFLQLGLIRRRRSVRSEIGVPCLSDARSLDKLRQVLPFQPTRAQERAIAEIAKDLASPQPMQRLLHGDVGSGKTLVAYAACELVMSAGRQAAIMAPTEILAEQHARTLGAWAKATGRRLALLTATTPKTPRKTTLAQLQAGRFADVWRLSELSGERLDRESILAMLQAGFIDIVIGTHALLAERVELHNLGLVVIDEQHRFGVGQRAALRRKGQLPHLLVMTATPIPRTLALTLYGDLDVTQLDELPPGRTPPVTRVLSGLAGLRRAVSAVRGAVAAGRQAYWVCPLIEESEKLDFQSVTARHASLVAALPELRVGLVHGRLGSAERDEVMERFRRGELHLLCATTVIEVGVDVPNASLMVVEGAERFGLAQLHQLRGRIGRGSGTSACLLLHDIPTGTAAMDLGTPAEARPEPPPRRTAARPAAAEEKDEPLPDRGSTSQARLNVLARSSNGFHIAEADLRLRGPGEVLGTRQAGLPPLRYADLLRDIDLLQLARREAAALLVRDPELDLPEHRLTRQLLIERWALADTTLE